MHGSSLQYFKAVAEEGSIRKAAERVNVSASAVNRQILKLGACFGTLLFERRRDGLRLTDEGRLVLNHVQGTLHDFEQLKGEIDSRRGIISGTVTILTLDSLTVHFLPEALSTFSSENPAIEIRVITGDPIESARSVAQGSADLGLTFQLHFPVRKGLSVLEDIPSPMHAIMPPDHELANRRSVTLDECAEHRLIFHDDSGSMRAFLGEDMQAFKHSHRPSLTSNTIGFTKQLLRRRVGIAFYTRLGFVEELARGGARCRSSQGEAPRRSPSRSRHVLGEGADGRGASRRRALEGFSRPVCSRVRIRCRVGRGLQFTGSSQQCNGCRELLIVTSTSRRDEQDALSRRIPEMSEREPGSGVRMCHEQGKTAVHLSRDGQYLVEHEPNGVLRYLPLNAGSRSGT